VLPNLGDTKMSIISNMDSTDRKLHYVPTFRTKAGEITALKHLQTSAKQRTIPIFQIMPKVSSTFNTDLVSAWGSLPLALDGSAQTGAARSAKDFAGLFMSLGTAGASVVPLIDVGADATNAPLWQLETRFSAVSSCVHRSLN
jgi:hypothetical protein